MHGLPRLGSVHCYLTWLGKCALIFQTDTIIVNCWITRPCWKGKCTLSSYMAREVCIVIPNWHKSKKKFESLNYMEMLQRMFTLSYFMVLLTLEEYVIVLHGLSLKHGLTTCVRPSEDHLDPLLFTSSHCGTCWLSSAHHPMKSPICGHSLRFSAGIGNASGSFGSVTHRNPCSADKLSRYEEASTVDSSIGRYPIAVRNWVKCKKICDWLYDLSTLNYA